MTKNVYFGPEELILIYYFRKENRTETAENFRNFVELYSKTDMLVKVLCERIAEKLLSISDSEYDSLEIYEKV